MFILVRKENMVDKLDVVSISLMSILVLYAHLDCMLSLNFDNI